MRDSMPRFAFSQRDSDSVQASPPPSPNQSPPNKISPAVLFIIVILAIIFFISGLLHLLVRLLVKKQPHSNPDGATQAGDPETIQRQLQQLFHLHDSGLDQTIIDSLPVFLYEEILGPNEPFDCAVCLCEFLKEDKLRLLPGCGHAFHLNCIDTWLLSNSTCPLCRGSLGVMVENTSFLFENTIEEDACRDDRDDGKLEEEKIVFSIRLGKFRNVSKTEKVNDAGQNGNACKEIGDTSSSNLDARRCFSMGSYQYILANSSLQVSCTSIRGRSMRFLSNATRNEIPDERKISASSRGESLSASKIWQRSGQKGDFRGHFSSQGNSILVRLPVMEEKHSDS
jgi:Ring finger domain